MFSSNQIFDVLIEPDQLEMLVPFAVGLSGSTEMFTREQGRVAVAFAEPAEGVYAIGRGSMPRCPWSGPIEAGKGWTDYPFDYDPEILSRVIRQWAAKQEYDPEPDTDGSAEKGLRCMSLMSAAENGFLPDYVNYASRWHYFEAIMVFVPEWLVYGK